MSKQSKHKAPTNLPTHGGRYVCDKPGSKPVLVIEPTEPSADAGDTTESPQPAAATKPTRR